MDHSDPTKLTSFKALTPAHNSGGFSFSRLFDSFNQRKTSQAPKLPSTEEQDTGRSEYRECKISQYNACQINDKKENAEREDFNSWLTKSISSQSKLFGGKEKAPEKKVVVVVPRKEKWRYRNVRTILRRLSSLTIDKRWHQTTGDFKDDFKQYWMPDEHCKECYECGGKFNTFRRRHHCRVCGQIFCYKCCNQEVHGKVIGFSGDIRVCNYCFKIVHAYLNDTFDKSIEALSEDIKACEPGYPYEFTGSSSSTNSKSGKYLEEPTSYRIKRSPSSNSVVSSVAAERSPTPTVQRSPFDMFGVTPSEANSIKQNYLRDLWRKIADPKNGIELQTHRYRLKIYQNCLVGNELIEWLITQQKANTRVQAVGVGQDLLDFGWIECVNPDLMFMDEYMLYQPTKIALLETEAVLIAGPLASSDESDVDSIEQSFRDASVREDVEDDDPNWIKQMATGKNVGEDDQLAGSSSASQFRKFSTGRRLDLDLVTVGSTDTKKADLSLQMNLDSQTAYENKEIYDQMNKVSFITHVPPLPLDTYVCVDGYQSNVKKKVPKPNNNASMSEDILRGVVFPRNNMEPEVHVEDHHEENGRMEGGERLAMERLSAASHYHINALLEQLLKQGNLSESWKEVVLPFVWKVSDKVIPDVRRDDDMDIRRYVWINKVPGGLKAESHFISGVVFRKNVAHKRMNVTFSQPSILMMSCAIEYQRVENKMSSLDPLVLQEYAFLQNFVKRVLALKPNVILVEKNVARFAQDMLLAGGVTLVHNIKQTVMENIARCTGADILQTMEQVTRPRLGKCQEFRLQKFALPNGKITALMYIDGCAPDLGCSLILRGGIEKTLIKVKKILEYLIYVAYQLKLEAKFLSDEFALPPPLEYLTPSSSTADQSVTSNAELKSPEKPEDEEDGLAISSMCGGKDSSIEELENTVAGLATTEELSESFKFQEVLKMIILSSSPFCNYPMPYLLTEEGEQSTNRHFRPKQIYWSRYVDESSVSHPLKLVEDDHEWMTNEDRVNNEIIMKDAHPFTDPSVLMDYITKEGHMGTIMNDFRARGGRIDLKFFQKYEDREKRSVFGHYLKESVEDFDEVDGNKSKVVVDEFPKPENQTLLNSDTKMDCFDAFNHQKIAVLFSSYSSESKNAPKPCISPWAVYMEFYGRNDITLGGFLERYCFRSSYICPAANCDIPMVNHVRYFAHGSASLYIHMRNLESPIPGYDRTILTWSWCRICKQVTPVVPLSFESWAMSFAKYLELRFYGNKYTRRASVEPCGHSLHHDHYQYFSFANMVASFKYRAIDLHEVIIPSSKVVIGKQRNPKFLFSDVNDLCRKVDSVINEIRDRVNEAMKSDENTGISAQRESILKEFLTDLEKEHSNTQNVIQVIKLKTDSLSKADSLSRALESSRSTSTASVATRASKQDQVFLSVNGSGDSEDGKPRDSNSSNVIKNPDYIDCVALHAEENPMTDEDVHLLWVDITNKVFYLKKNICESVEHWNFKLQEFVTQDRKREKTAAPHTRAPASEHSEFYPDQMSTEMDPPQPKTVTHLHPEPVSEVFLTNGTILRQTHYGTKPRESSPFMDSLGSDSPAKVRKNSTPSIPNLSIDNPERTKIEETIKENDDTIGGVNGLRGPYIYTESIALTDDNKNEEFPVSNKEQSNEVSSWIKVNKFESLGGDSAGDIRDGCESDNESMTVEFNDDTGELTDIQSIVGDDESECPSEIEMAEEEDDDVVDIRLGQSAIDFEDNQNDEENIQQGPSSQLQGTSKNSKSVGAGVPAFSEFPKISEERLERVEYLTPNEVKAMQVARRRRNEWESRIRTVNDKKQQEKDHLKSLQRGRPLPFAENHFDTTGPALPIVGGEKEKKPEKKTSKITTATSATTKPKMTITTKADRKTQPGKIKGKTDTKQRIDPIQKLDPKKKSEPTTKQKDLIPKKRPAIKIKETTDTAISKGKQVKNPLLRRLVQNTHESSGEDSSDNAKQKAKKIPVKKVDKKNPIPTTNFAPVQMETTERAENLKQKEVAPENIKRNEVPPPENPFVDFRTTPTKPTPIPKITKSEMKNQTLNPACHRQKRIGHRRMKSAPFRIAISHEEESAPSELTPESPFIVVSPVLTKDEGLRSRSQSVGNRTSKYARGQKELSRLAERVVHEDRIDAERDVPEVLQIDGNTMKSASAGEIIGRLDGSPGFLLDGKLSVKRHLSSESERQTSDAAGQGSGKKLTKSDYDATDGKMAEGGPSKRGGSEKMKKIISQVFSSVAYQPIQRPFPPSEQYLPQVGGTSSIVINEREPTSLIAFTLSSRDYATQLQNIQDLLAGKKIQASNLTPSSLISQPNSPNVTRKQILNVSMRTESQQRPTTASPSSCNNAIGSSAGLMMRPIAPEQIARPKSWAGTTDVIIEASGFMNKTDSPPTRSESPALKRVYGKRHPLSSTEFEPSTEVLIDVDESSDDVMDGSSVRSDDPKKKEEEKTTVDHHVKLQFQNEVAKFYCSVYYAEQFRQLRETIFPEGEERFIQSLARCKFWKATGGKSGSSFSKSYDDRFVMKQMSRLEVQSFVDFGPRYFSYINKAIKENRPTALAKLLGVYRIGFKNSVTNATMRQDVLVMENLFHEKKVNKIFDLKGSLRGRKVHMSAKEDVLMDENLLEMICDTPLFIRAHSKAVLSKAIHNDTEFLSTNMVMDYSLLVGIDEAKQKLVVGIIDYIRTYTWDKKLESYVKSTGILGGAGKMPTVVSPDLYRKRFTEAMQRYFLMVPDKWTGFGNDLS